MGLGDLLTALWVGVWFIPISFFTVLFVEWSARSRGENNLYARMVGFGKINEGQGDSQSGGRRGDLSRRLADDAPGIVLDGETER